VACPICTCHALRHVTCHVICHSYWRELQIWFWIVLWPVICFAIDSSMICAPFSPVICCAIAIARCGICYCRLNLLCAACPEIWTWSDCWIGFENENAIDVDEENDCETCPLLV